MFNNNFGEHCACNKPFKFATDLSFVKMPKTCCVPGCLNRNDLYKFPLFNQIIFDIWKQRIANPRFKNLSDQRIYHMYSVCPEHFIEECKTTDKRQLKKYSLPNINVPGNFLILFKSVESCKTIMYLCTGFHEEPNIRNAFYSPKKEIDVAGQGDIPKFNKADTNDKNSANGKFLTVFIYSKENLQNTTGNV